MSKVFDLWKEVGGAFGPSGREDAVRETIAGIAGAYIDDITTDALGNLICRKKGAGKKVLFAAHMDSIGVVATYIDENGFIRFSQVGGLYYADLVNITVRFANGTRGVISFEEKTPMKDMTLAHMFIDIGAKNAEEAKKLVQIGDFAVFEAAGGGRDRKRPVFRVHGTGGGRSARRRRGGVRSRAGCSDRR